MESPREPQTLQEAIVFFAVPENCLNYLVARRPEWKDGVVCPICGSTKVGFLKNQLRWQCSNRHDKRQFSVKVGTIMEDSPIGLDKWLAATWMILNCKNGISSCEIARALGVTQKTTPATTQKRSTVGRSYRWGDLRLLPAAARRDDDVS